MCTLVIFLMSKVKPFKSIKPRRHTYICHSGASFLCGAWVRSSMHAFVEIAKRKTVIKSKEGKSLRWWVKQNTKQQKKED